MKRTMRLLIFIFLLSFLCGGTILFLHNQKIQKSTQINSNHFLPTVIPINTVLQQDTITITSEATAPIEPPVYCRLSGKGSEVICPQEYYCDYVPVQDDSCPTGAPCAAIHPGTCHKI